MQPTITTEASTQAEVQQPRSLRQYGGLVLRGLAMGASDIVPGVSGGTMAFILGIYEELIDSIRTVGRPVFLQTVFRLRIKEALQILNWQFLLAIAAGIFIAILSLARGLEWLLQNQPVYLWSFFFGLVLASVITVSKRIDRWTPPLMLMLVLGAVGAFLLVGAVPVQTPNDWWFLFLSGALAICAMILPGISGAFILVLLGKYQYVLSAVNSRDIITVGLVGLGAAIGIITFAQILGYLFKRYHDMTVALLTGLMLGSLRKIWPWKVDVSWLQDADGLFILDSHGARIVAQQANVLPDFSTGAGIAEFVIAAILALAGLGVILVLDRLANSRHA
jgi:putative membrane protein